MITLVRIFTDFSNEVPYQVIPFADAGKAEDFARDIFPNDGLLGIVKVELANVPTDDDAIEQFWTDLNDEVDA